MDGLYDSLVSDDELLPYRRLWQAYILQRFVDIRTETGRSRDTEINRVIAQDFFERHSEWFHFVCFAAGYDTAEMLEMYRRAKEEMRQRSWVLETCAPRRTGRTPIASIPRYVRVYGETATTTSCGV